MASPPRREITLKISIFKAAFLLHRRLLSTIPADKASPPEHRPYLITKLGGLQQKRTPERKVFPRAEDRKNLIETPRHGIISTVGKEKTGPENRLPVHGLAARRGGEKERSEG
jgi:hypothetical protein